MAVPKGTSQVFAENGWQILLKSEIVPGTENFRAQPFNRVYYCGKLDADKARIVWEETRQTHEKFIPLRIAPDGTVTSSVYENKLLVIGPDDPPGHHGDGTAVVLPGQQGRRGMVLLHATGAGFVAYPNELNKPVPVYFVPLVKRTPVVEKAVELCSRDTRSFYPPRTGFHVSDKWIVWADGSLEVATGTKRKRESDPDKVTDLAIDGELVVTNSLSHRVELW